MGLAEIAPALTTCPTIKSTVLRSLAMAALCRIANSQSSPVLRVHQRGATSVRRYPARAREIARVAVAIAWSELADRIDAARPLILAWIDSRKAAASIGVGKGGASA